jgi:hypothetical protein
MRLILIILVLASFGVEGNRAAAQIRRYQPARPTISPYLNLLRRDVGPLPNYHALVRPYLEQQSRNQEMSRAIQRNAERLEMLTQGPQRLRPAPVRPTGSGGRFQNYHHRSGEYFRLPRRIRVARP